MNACRSILCGAASWGGEMVHRECPSRGSTRELKGPAGDCATSRLFERPPVRHLSRLFTRNFRISTPPRRINRTNFDESSKSDSTFSRLSESNTKVEPKPTIVLGYDNAGFGVSHHPCLRLNVQPKVAGISRSRLSRFLIDGLNQFAEEGRT